MDTSESTIRNLRKKTRSWLASLIYYSARGRANLDTFSQRLQSIFKPMLRPDILRETVKNGIPEKIEAEESTGIKKRILSRLTPNKIGNGINSAPEIPCRKSLTSAKNEPFTLRRFVVTWAVLTDQPPRDFIIRIFPCIKRLYQGWHETTGNAGFSDEDFRAHPEESACFWSGVFRVIIKETPEENLNCFMRDGIQALGALVEITGLDKTIYDLLEQATDVITRDTAKKIESAVKTNPGVRPMVNIPELRALVLREEEKLGWRKNTEEQAVGILQENLSSELKEVVGNKDEVIRASIESVSRRGLLNNLEAALKGQLKPRFVESIWHFLQSISRIVTSTWEFETSSPIKEQMVSIRQWLFRR